MHPGGSRLRRERHGDPARQLAVQQAAFQAAVALVDLELPAAVQVQPVRAHALRAGMLGPRDRFGHGRDPLVSARARIRAGSGALRCGCEVPAPLRQPVDTDSSPATEPRPRRRRRDRSGRTAGKGRPTPKRREAEARSARPGRAAAAHPARGVPAGQGQPAGPRSSAARDAAERRERMAAGDQRYLLPRDRGPVRGLRARPGRLPAAPERPVHAAGHHRDRLAGAAVPERAAAAQPVLHGGAGDHAGRGHRARHAGHPEGAGQVPGREDQRAGHGLVRVHPGQPAAPAAGPEAAGEAGRRRSERGRGPVRPRAGSSGRTPRCRRRAA